MPEKTTRGMSISVISCAPEMGLLKNVRRMTSKKVMKTMMRKHPMPPTLSHLQKEVSFRAASSNMVAERASELAGADMKKTSGKSGKAAAFLHDGGENAAASAYYFMPNSWNSLESFQSGLYCT